MERANESALKLAETPDGGPIISPLENSGIAAVVASCAEALPQKPINLGSSSDDEDSERAANFDCLLERLETEE